MARVVGGALLVRMFLHMFLIPILVSVVSLFTYPRVLFIHTLYLSGPQGSFQKLLIRLQSCIPSSMEPWGLVLLAGRSEVGLFIMPTRLMLVLSLRLTSPEQSVGRGRY